MLRLPCHHGFRRQRGVAAAVTEICELVDDSYTVLQLEISRSHKENEALRRKLELIESIIARGHRGNFAMLGYDAPPEAVGPVNYPGERSSLAQLPTAGRTKGSREAAERSLAVKDRKQTT
ncbi:unnamed protein product [Arctogadus glacialis]